MENKSFKFCMLYIIVCVVFLLIKVINITHIGTLLYDYTILFLHFLLNKSIQDTTE